MEYALKLTNWRRRLICWRRVAATIAGLSVPLAAGAADQVIESVFYEDNGVVCTIFVSVSEEDVEKTNAIRQLAWSSLNAGDFDVCESTVPTELGVITVRGVDEYRQPDWSRTIEHMYFEITDWPALKAACDTAMPGEQCAAKLEPIMVESGN